MINKTTSIRLLWIVSPVLLAVVFIFLTILPGSAKPIHQRTEEYCLSCHGKEGNTYALPNGDQLNLYISKDVLSHSVHSPLGIECEACHTEITTYPHPAVAAQSKREFSRTVYTACKKCHSKVYDNNMDSVHAKVASEGKQEAPICTDCHGAHDVQSPDKPRSKVSQTCNKCHSDINHLYEGSVHGKALLEDNNNDVPVCTDCHGVHNIQDPRTEEFRINTPELCARCHANKELMDKYGLNSDVYDIYKLSWHGVDVSVYKAKWPTIWHDSAVCTDCHGVHDILKTDDPQSKVNPQNLLATCQECHPDAGPNWTGAWTGHNQISLERTPFVYYTNLFYSSLTPFILWICVIYVVLQIIHLMVDRARRSLK